MNRESSFIPECVKKNPENYSFRVRNRDNNMFRKVVDVFTPYSVMNPHLNMHCHALHINTRDALKDLGVREDER